MDEDPMGPVFQALTTGMTEDQTLMMRRMAAALMVILKALVETSIEER